MGSAVTTLPPNTGFQLPRRGGPVPGQGRHSLGSLGVHHPKQVGYVDLHGSQLIPARNQPHTEPSESQPS